MLLIILQYEFYSKRTRHSESRSYCTSFLLLKCILKLQFRVRYSYNSSKPLKSFTYTLRNLINLTDPFTKSRAITYYLEGQWLKYTHCIELIKNRLILRLLENSQQYCIKFLLVLVLT